MAKSNRAPAAAAGTRAVEATSDAVRAAVAEAVAAADLHLESLTEKRIGSGSVVNVVIDLLEHELGSLDADRLAETSRAISRVLDDLDVGAGQYILEVTTPGTARPLSQPRHYRRARTRRVQVTTADGKQVSGRLVDVVGADPDATLVFADGVQLPLARVRAGKVLVELTNWDEPWEEESSED